MQEAQRLEQRFAYPYAQLHSEWGKKATWQLELSSIYRITTTFLIKATCLGCYHVVSSSHRSMLMSPHPPRSSALATVLGVCVLTARTERAGYHTTDRRPCSGVRFMPRKTCEHWQHLRSSSWPRARGHPSHGRLKRQGTWSEYAFAVVAALISWQASRPGCCVTLGRRV